MSTISGVSANGGSDPWAAMKAQRSQMQAKMFAKVDTDSNGSVNPSELGTMLDTIGQKTGATFDDAAKVLTAMDSNADGSLSSDELGEEPDAATAPFVHHGLCPNPQQQRKHRQCQR